MVNTFLIATLGIICWSLYTRRHTWRCKWETAGNRSMVFQAVGLVCTAPGLTALGYRFHDITGRWNVEDFVGHCFFIAAAGSTVHHALTRMEDQTKFMRHVVAVIGVSFIARAYLFFTSQGSYTYTADYFAMPEGIHTKLYWLVTCATVIYLLGYMARLVWVLRRNPLHRRIADVYLFGAAVGIGTCAAKIVDAFTTDPALQAPFSVWAGCCIGVMGFAFGYGYSWKQRVHELEGVRA